MFKKPWVLIVEDELEIVEILSIRLKKEGFEVSSCSKAPRAIQLMNNQKYDCLLLDMRLEQGSGEQILATIRRDIRNLNYATPALVMSAFLDPVIVKRIGKDIQGAFVKPFERDALISKIKSICAAKLGPAPHSHPGAETGAEDAESRTRSG